VPAGDRAQPGERSAQGREVEEWVGVAGEGKGAGGLRLPGCGGGEHLLESPREVVGIGWSGKIRRPDEAAEVGHGGCGVAAELAELLANAGGGDGAAEAGLALEIGKGRKQ
jgi:hypothetical protein